MDGLGGMAACIAVAAPAALHLWTAFWGAAPLPELTSACLPPPASLHPFLPQGQEPPTPAAPQFTDDQRLAPLRSLLRGRAEGSLPAGEVEALSATQLRDALLALGPLDAGWVKQVNAAEAEYWRRW